jgi:hypothetical protein
MYISYSVNTIKIIDTVFILIFPGLILVQCRGEFKELERISPEKEPES